MYPPLIPRLDFSFLNDQQSKQVVVPPPIIIERSRSIPRTYNEKVREMNEKIVHIKKRSISPLQKTFKERLLDQINEQTRLELLRKELEVKKQSNYEF